MWKLRVANSEEQDKRTVKQSCFHLIYSKITKKFYKAYTYQILIKIILKMEVIRNPLKKPKL